MKIKFDRCSNNTRIYDNNDKDVTGDFDMEKIEVVAEVDQLTKVKITFVNVETHNGTDDGAEKK